MRRLWIVGMIAVIACCVSACASSEGRSLDFGEAAEPPARTRERPYPCPSLPPLPKTPCGTRDLSCGYADRTCTCLPDPNRGFGTFSWSCDDGSAPAGCPETQPKPGTSCTTLFDSPECAYGKAISCRCASEALEWACWDPGACPRGEPEEASACELVGMTCAYDALGCECFEDGWRC